MYIHSEMLPEWRASAPSVEELLTLQLAGYSGREIIRTKHDLLKAMAAKLEKERVKAKHLLALQQELGITTLSYFDKKYPKHFSENLGDDTPLLLHLLGNQELLYAENCVTIIGSRKANQQGLEAAYELAKKYATEGRPVVSGLALGCDTAAHTGCLDAGGRTIAIVASGLDRVHPKSNAGLQERILEQGGLVVSEHSVGVKANPTRLVARCRMQVVLSPDVVVAQCPVISGTMYAVEFARLYDGDIYGWENTIYAVPYTPYTDESSGNQFLLEHGLATPINYF